MSILVASSVLEAMRSHAHAALPNECCGLLLGSGDRVETALATQNVHQEPGRHFEIDPQALINAYRAARNGGRQVLGYYHSHPIGEARPSTTDRKMALKDGSIWAIVAGRDVRLWRDGEDGFSELSYRMDAS